MLAGALVLLVTASLVRFVNLGYADFQGDEARAALRAAAVIQGYEDVLMLHKKGPTEILIPTALYTLTGHLTESTARLPFAIANLVALFAAWYLGWRLFHPLAGWLAAMFLALDGYFIGFARIVQYQSVVFLMTILAVLLLYRLVRRPQAMTAYLTLAAMFMATGMLVPLRRRARRDSRRVSVGGAALAQPQRMAADPGGNGRGRGGGRRAAGRLLLALHRQPALLRHALLPDRPAHRRQPALQQPGRRLPAHHALQHHLLRAARHRADRDGMVRIYWQHLRRWLAVVRQCIAAGRRWRSPSGTRPG
jgi:hypothetical protein